MSKTAFNSRQLMELAVEVMKLSIQEDRDDENASPAVGAIIYMSDGTTETAYRGELREGDHAEFTLLEKKMRDTKLDGSILFATLEPCAPGARGEGKLPCSERIILARIKEVWVGIEDPDPKVDRKGIAYLESKGVTVHMFDRDLQEVITTVNEKFIAQAIERAAAAAAEKEEPIILTSLENAEPATNLTDFSKAALEKFVSNAKLPESVGTEAFNRRLAQQGLVQVQNGVLSPTGFGILLFGNEPRSLLQQAGLLATIHYADSRTEKKDFDGPMVLIPGQVEEWLKNRLPNIMSRTGMQRTEDTVIPFELIRESIINALVHRDYDIKGAKCQLIVSPDKIEVMSPGSPLPQISLEQLQSFTAPMLSRNPQLHYVFAKIGLAEERGLGMETFKNLPPSVGLPVPKYSVREPYLVLTFFSSSESVATTVRPSALDSLNEDEKQGWKYITSRLITTAPEYSAALGFDERKTQRHLRKFMDLGLVNRIGQGRATRYEVAK